MKILILYGTNSGGTLLAAKQFAKLAEAKGHRVRLEQADAVAPKELKRFDLVVLGSCTWEDVESGKRLEGQLQFHMAKFAERLKGKTFRSSSFAVFGLGDHLYTDLAAAANHLEALVQRVQGHLIGRPLKILGYFNDQANQDARIRAWAESILSTVQR